MELAVENLEGGIKCISLSGRLDLKGTQEIDLKFTGLVAAGKQSVIVDMSKVEFVASIGIRTLLNNIKALQPVKAKMVILKPQKMVEDILKLAGIDMYAPIVHDQAAALEEVKRAAAQ
jgi:anti-sigma B factor antagonist